MEEKLRTFSVPLTWSMWGRLKVKARSREEAIQFALGSETPLPEGSYLDDSIALDEEGEIEESEWTEEE